MTHEQAAGASRWRMYVVWALWLPVWSGEGDWSLHGTKRRAVEIWNIVYRWSDGLPVTLDKSEEDPIAIDAQYSSPALCFALRRLAVVRVYHVLLWRLLQSVPRVYLQVPVKYCPSVGGHNGTADGGCKFSANGAGGCRSTVFGLILSAGCSHDACNKDCAACSSFGFHGVSGAWFVLANTPNI
ncbi:hypothetical protein PC120_g12270 [Phytophthora cactorum]|nr:hypothetical protein PC120_g12270 [Phytophthora cactorum]